MKSNWTNLLVFLLALAGLGIYIYKHVDWNAPKKQRITSVEINGQTVPLHQVKIEQIPQAVYDSMKDNPHWSNHLTGNKKRVLLITWNGCPYARAYRQALDKVFKKGSPLQKQYVKDIEVTGQSVGGSCKGPLAASCPLMWIMDHCMGGICIINPQTHEAIVDESQNAQQILPLLTAYAAWTTEPLLKE